MRGLILKDFINLKKNLKIFGILTILYGVMSMASGDAGFFSTVFTVLFAVLTLSLYSYDEMAKWDSFALTMPISKDNIVQGKYIMMLLLTLIGIIFGALFSVFICLATGGDSPLSGIQNCGIAAAIVIFFYSITLPFITKLGVEKARLILFAAYIIPFAIVLMVKKAVGKGVLTIPDYITTMINTFEKYAYIIIPIIILLILFISYQVSIQIYRKKDF